MNKDSFRTHFKSVRGSVSQRCEKEEEIFRRLTENPIFLKSKSVFLYASAGTEVSTDKIASFALEAGKTVAFPVCCDKDGKMEFYRVTDMNMLLCGMYSIREPDTTVCEPVFPDSDTLLLVPALSFDNDGYRLGYGKGYYDRYLERFLCATVGLSFSDCVCDELPRNNFDKKVNCLITDKTVYIFDSSKEE